MKPERLARTVICESPWVNHCVDRVRMPDGRVIEQHHLLDFAQPVVAAVDDGASALLSCYPMPGIANKVAHIFRCRATERVGEPDPGEVSEVRWFSRQEVRQLLREGAITCGISLTALLLHLQEAQMAADGQR